jgi:hypothetical protein
MRGYILCLCFFPGAWLSGQDTIPLPLSGTEVNVLAFGKDLSSTLLYNMHDNENTSALAGRILSKKHGGSYFELMHTGKRNISFLFGEDSIHIDPNRIYTDTGIWLQLAKNKITDTLAYQMIANWRDSLLSILDIQGRSLVIALHNNTNQQYNFRSYMPGEEYADEAQAVFKGCVRDKDDFYFVTDYRILDRLCFGQYHVVMQANDMMTDDGSLSVYCGQLGIPYINVEAQHGHLFRQLRMLLFAYGQLVDKGE